MIEFEHSLFKLLLLVAILSAKPPGRKWLLLIIGISFILALVPPPIFFQVPWTLLLGLIIPLLLWQNARRVIRARWLGKWKDILLWLGSATIFAALFLGFKELETSSAILFGLIAASLLWMVGENEENATIAGLIGPFTLIFLLTEVDPLIQTPNQYIGGIFSGVFLGGLIAFLAIFLALKAPQRIRDWIAIGQIYLSYGFALLVGISAVAASLASVIVFVTLGTFRGLWRSQRITPTPLNTWPGFSIILVVFLLLGWQSHYPLSNWVLFEAAAGFVVGFLIAWLGQRIKLDAFPQDIALWRVGLRVALLLFPALLIWPRQALEQPIWLAAAFGIAIANLAIARIALDYFLENAGETQDGNQFAA